jgi:hypothetical protein
MLYLLRQLGARIADFQKNTGGNNLKIKLAKKQIPLFDFLDSHKDILGTSLKSAIEQYQLEFEHRERTIKVYSKNNHSRHDVNISLDLIIDSLDPGAHSEMKYQICAHNYMKQLVGAISHIFNFPMCHVLHCKIKLAQIEVDSLEYLMLNTTYLKNLLLSKKLNLDLIEGEITRAKHVTKCPTTEIPLSIIHVNMKMDYRTIESLNRLIYKKQKKQLNIARNLSFTRERL